MNELTGSLRAIVCATLYAMMIAEQAHFQNHSLPHKLLLLARRLSRFLSDSECVLSVRRYFSISPPWKPFTLIVALSQSALVD